MSVRHWRRWAFGLLAFGLVLSIPAFGAEKHWNPEGWWRMPEGTSSYSGEIDNLYVGVLWLTGIIFLITEAILVYCLVAFRHRPGRKSGYTHGNHTMELAWTITPAVILGILAFLQSSTWNLIKRDIPTADAVNIQLFAHQYEWNFRYAGNDNTWGTKDDVLLVNQLYVPVNKNIVLEQNSKDVIHSFFLPNMRLKQDVVPGLPIRVWFKPIKTTKEMQVDRPIWNKDDGTTQEWNYEIACAELCGADHSQMKGTLYVLSQEEYDAKMKTLSQEFADDKWERPKIWKLWKVGPDGKRLPMPKKPVAEHGH